VVFSRCGGWRATAAPDVARRWKMEHEARCRLCIAERAAGGEEE
jgi:hypothetical protein